MKIYNSYTLFEFGKFKNWRFDDILGYNPEYINWCVIHLDHFLIDIMDIEEYQEINSDFELTPKALSILNKKWELYNKKDKNYTEDLSDNSEDTEWANEIPDYDEWLNDEFGDQAGTAHWNMD